MPGVLYGDEVIPGRRAGSGVGKHNAENPKQTAKSQTLLRRRSTLPWKIASYTSIVCKSRLGNQLSQHGHTRFFPMVEISGRFFRGGL